MSRKNCCWISTPLLQHKPSKLTPFLSLCCRAAEKLSVECPSPLPAQKPSRFTGFFLLPEPTTVKHSLPIFPDFVAELTSALHKPLSTRTTVHGHFLELDREEETDLVNIPPIEPSLASYLAPSHKHVVGNSATLPSKHCRFSTSVHSWRKFTGHRQAQSNGLSSGTMLQIYQAMSLAELRKTVPSDSPPVPLLNEVRIAMDHILCVSGCVALSWGRGMVSTVVAQRKLWLTLPDVPEKDQAIYLDEPVLAAGLFGRHSTSSR